MERLSRQTANSFLDLTDTETILYGDLDMQQIVYLKYACDSAGHYSRPDVVKLAANYKPQSITQKFEDTNFGDS